MYKLRTLFLSMLCIAVAGAVSSSARADCQAGVCISQDLRFKGISVNITAQRGATHFNVRNSCSGGQTEVSSPGRYSVALGPGSPARCQLSVQYCLRGGSVGPFGGRSSCGSWASFSLSNPANTVVGGGRQCKGGFCAILTYHTSNNFTIKLTSWPSSTHRNIRTDSGSQIQGDGGTFAGRGVSVQACNKGFLGKSSCTNWVRFSD